MPRVIQGSLSLPTGRFAIVAARFNQSIVQRLVEGAEDGLCRHGVAEDAIDVVWVPGSFEIPPVAKKLSDSQAYSGIICLGTVIRGETDHYDHVAGQVAAGVAQVARESEVPVIFGVLTCDTVEQALNRAGLKGGNKGFEAALATIEMANLCAELKGIG